MLTTTANHGTARKYDAVAKHFGFYDILFAYPRDFRAKGAEALGEVKGGRVLEVGCGSGLNFKFLVEGVGPEGTIEGIDLSHEMIGVAQTRCARHAWDNVSARTADAGEFRAEELFDAAYFGLSFTILDDPCRVLDNILDQVRSGGRVAVLETRIPTWMPRVVQQWLEAYALRTFGTQPGTKPWEIFADYEERGLVKNVRLETVREYSFYVLWAEKV